ncbi:MAG: acetate--CoA ligase family protein [Intrasporangium sp.]|uniref:acetate--CoA ligase family protein n=1 Tax=Intrasporangium sp. TaxID=1925024 RepID=UPI002647032D|nr:acetate--CoA ligase [Intrasporangium sp.]MDN5796582.1 acetate--CoA ligase family protein [Intrasporangium sp.]
MSTDLRVFSEPRSVAVVGASADTAKWGYWVARGALRGAHRREVHLVNAKGAVIEGTPSVRSLSELDTAPELVVLCAPARTVPAVIDEALAMGAKGFLGITAHIDVANGQVGLERELAARIRHAGARIVGPNCLGIYDAAADLDLVWGSFTPGHVAIVSQSGQLGLELSGLAAHAGLGISRFVSIGNQVDVTATDLLEDLAQHETTRVVVLYLESFAAGRDLVSVLARLREAGKPVIVLTVGASDASRDAAKSHTGAMTASTDVVAAACAAAGAVLVQTPVQAIDLAHLLLGSPLPQGRRVAIVSDSGGQGALAADTMARDGLQVPRFSAGTSGRLAALLPAGAGVANPVDLAGAGEQDLTTYSKVVETILGSGEVDTVVLSGYFGCYGSDTPALLDRELSVVTSLADSVRVHERPVVVHSMSHDSDAVRHMRAQAVPTLHTIDAAARSIAFAADLAARDGRQTGTVAPGGAQTGETAGYLEARAGLMAYGVSYPQARRVTSAEEALAAARGLRSPLVLKAGHLEHKTEVEGVKVGIATPEDARDAYVEMSERLGPGEYVLEEMDARESTVELIVGSRRDGSFGPVVVVGLGGIHAELYRDVALALAPVTPEAAVQMITSLRALPLLRGFRGRPVVDIESAASVVAAVSRLIAEQPEVVECEINPLRVGPTGAVAVDALVVAASPSATGPADTQSNRVKEEAR